MHTNTISNISACNVAEITPEARSSLPSDSHAAPQFFNHKASLMSSDKIEPLLRDRNVCKTNPIRYIGSAYCAWLGYDIPFEFYTNIILFAKNNPELLVNVVYGEEHKSKNIMERLFSSGENTPTNIKLVSGSKWIDQYFKNAENMYSGPEFESIRVLLQHELKKEKKLFVDNSNFGAGTKDNLFKLIFTSDPFIDCPDIFGPSQDGSGYRYKVSFDVDSIIEINVHHFIEQSCGKNKDKCGFYAYDALSSRICDHSFMFLVCQWLEGGNQSFWMRTGKVNVPYFWDENDVNHFLPNYIQGVSALDDTQLPHYCINPKCSLIKKHDKNYREKWFTRLQEACGLEKATSLVKECEKVYYERS